MTKDRNYMAGTERDRQAESETEEQRRSGKSNLLEIKPEHSVKEEKKRRGDYGRLYPFTLSPLECYQPSWDPVVDTIFLKTVSPFFF